MSILRTIGIDISKDWLDVFAAPEGRASRLSNDAAGFRKLIAWIGPEVDRIAYEPTGPFHRDLEDTLLKAGLPLYAINPFQVRSFARSLGRRAKTDAVDARMLATMAPSSRICARLKRDRRGSAISPNSSRSVTRCSRIASPPPTAAGTCALPWASASTGRG